MKLQLKINTQANSGTIEDLEGDRILLTETATKQIGL